MVREWRWEQMRRRAYQVVLDVAGEAYSSWFESLEDEQPPDLDLTAALWGQDVAPRLVDSAARVVD